MITKYDIGDIVMLPFEVTDIKISGKSDIKYNLSSNVMMQPILKNPTFHLEAVNIRENDIYALPQKYKNKPKGRKIKKSEDMSGEEARKVFK